MKVEPVRGALPAWASNVGSGPLAAQLEPNVSNCASVA